MNMNDLQVALPFPKIHPGDADPNEIYTFQNPRHQDFALPYPIIKYIFTNPTPKAWKKLIMTCKYFFPKYAVEFVRKFEVISDISRKYDRVRVGCEKGSLDLDQVNIKLWLYDEFQAGIAESDEMALSLVIPKIFKCDLRILDLSFFYLTLDEYKFLTSSGTIEQLRLAFLVVVNPDGRKVSGEKFFEQLPNLKIMQLKMMHFPPETAMKMAEILPSFKKLRKVCLHDLDETFDIFSFSDFLLKNETVCVHLMYNPDAVYPFGVVQSLPFAFMKKINNVVAKAFENPNLQVPEIVHPGIDFVQYEIYSKEHYNRCKSCKDSTLSRFFCSKFYEM